MPNTVYIDTSLLLAAFTNEPSQQTALALLQDSQWTQVCVSDWTLMSATLTCIEKPFYLTI